jgi:cytochrome c oxidase subunit 2
VVRYRRRDGRGVSARSEANLVEGVVALAIAAVVALLVSATFVTEARVDRTGAGSVRIDVTAFQWGWRFSYPGEGVSVVGNSVANPTFAVPAGRTIEFSLATRDVIHSFWVPDARFKRDAIPGRLNRFDLVFGDAEEGEHDGVCAEFCGLRHSRMGFTVAVLSESSFARWLGAHRSEGR